MERFQSNNTEGRFQIFNPTSDAQQKSDDTQGRFQIFNPTSGVDTNDLAPATREQEEIAGLPNRILRGIKQPTEGYAQKAINFLPEEVVDTVNEAADYVGGEGTFLGDLGIKSLTKDVINERIINEQREFDAARRATGTEGDVDIGGFVGEMLNPVNIGLASVIGPVTTKAIPPAFRQRFLDAAGRLGLVGAGAAAAQPITDIENIGTETAKQLAIGGAAGAIAGPLLQEVATSAGRFIGNMRSGATQPNANVGDDVINHLVDDGIDVNQIPKETMVGIIKQVSQALGSGKELNPSPLVRGADFDRFGITPTRGQVTRDAGQFSREKNLQGMEDVGEGITQRFVQQEEQVADVLRKRSQGALDDDYEIGNVISRDLESKNLEMQDKVRKAYKKFQDSTGKELEVPMEGIAQDYSKISKDFEGNIPTAVSRRFEELGILTGKKNQVLDIEGAEDIIRVINDNYDPMNKPATRALDRLRTSLIESIDNTATEFDDTLAAQLAKNARATASDRFKTIADNPAFKAVIDQKIAPDDFMKKYVIGNSAKTNDVARLMKLVSGSTRKKIKTQSLRYLQSKAFGVNTSGDKGFSSNGFNKALKDIGTKKLNSLIGRESTEEMQALGRVMSNIKSRPAGESVNTSRTGQAIFNMLSGAGGAIKGLPIIRDFIVKPFAGSARRKEARNALAGLPKEASELDSKAIKAIARLIGPDDLQKFAGTIGSVSFGTSIGDK